MSEEKRMSGPLKFRIAYWWGFGFSAVFLLYGAVSLVLGFLDRKYAELAQPFLFLMIGAILMYLAYAYRELKIWGWYGQVTVNGLIVILALVGFRHMGNLVLLVFAAAALVLLLSNETRNYLYQRR
jgi:hypothetical protein